MSETTQTAGTSEATSADAGAVEGAAGSGVPQGFVPVAELESERQRAREFQSRYDQLVASSAGNGGAGSAGESDGGATGFDPEAFRASLLKDVYGVNQMVQATTTLKAEFPHADPALFTPDRVAQFRSPEALRFAVEDSHRRVATILDSEKAAIEQRLRDELAGGNPPPGGPPGAPPIGGGDPTAEQLLALPMDEWEALEIANPGVLDRVLAGAESQ